MFVWPGLVPFAEGEAIEVKVRRAVFRLTGRAVVTRLSDRELALAVEIPRQGVFVPETRLVYRYRLPAADQAALVAVTWNDRHMEDGAARIEPEDGGRAVRVAAALGGAAVSWRIGRAGPRGLVVDEVRGHPLVAGASVRLHGRP